MSPPEKHFAQYQESLNFLGDEHLSATQRRITLKELFREIDEGGIFEMPLPTEKEPENLSH